ncbi:hypothetical protein BBD42_06870 [Paenibacillus sp. BIHB 4019]|uniref:Glycosyl transferase n=1 Tax=Paenibacillus sp. BIHB 4019 TaxID=1870819 RepID=A0A1B2DEU1_9BACL|nr:glycosyltransferase family 4 protein [Paenibacillus sp. BIHB 4019]ANY66216.1 hypothetical protein BBD42_06870 [Paenibacillus sp. BIHB 4019]
MKIGLVSYWCIPYTGGVSTYVLALQKGLEERGHEVDILSHNQSGLHYHIVNKGKSIDKQTFLTPIMKQIGIRFNMKSRNYDAWLAAMEGERLAFRQALTTFTLTKYDVLHAQDVISATAVSEIKPKNTPLVVTLHGKLEAEWKLQGVISDPSPAATWASTLDQYGSRVGDRIIVPSKWLKQQYESTSDLEKDPFDVIPYGFDTLSFLRQAISLKGAIPESSLKLIVCPARLDAVKGHEVLLHALELLRKRRSDWVCWLVGDGPLRPRLEQLTNHLKLQQHVMFLGHRNDMAALLSQADMVVAPSIHDNLPFAIMEAQVAGKPIIASDAGGIPEMIADGESGLLFTSGRADLLCERINKLLDDDWLQKRLANQARYHGLRQWSLDSMTERTLQLYDEALQAKQRGGK